MGKIAEGMLKKIQNQEVELAVLGLGYVGLPLMAAFCKKGFQVTGIDVDLSRISTLKSGASYIPDVSSRDIQEILFSKQARVTSDLNLLKTADVVYICVPTPLGKSKDPDLSFVLHSVGAIRDCLTPGKLVVLESTTFPGTTQEIVLPLLQESGLKVGEEFFLAFSPERVDPGNPQFFTGNTPRVVGGITLFCTRLAQAVYEQIVDKVIPVSSAKVAETVKLLENTFRSVNIGLVNEMALMCNRLGINVWEVIDAAATKPFGFIPFYPGPGIGGHCIPVDPFYLSWKARQNGFESRFIELAGSINSRMPKYVVERISEALNERGKCLKGARMLIVGVAYKRDINDVRESPALDILSLLLRKGAAVCYLDPLVPRLSIGGLDLESEKESDDLYGTQDCVVILADHRCLDYSKLLKASSLVMDTRNALKGFMDPKIVQL